MKINPYKIRLTIAGIVGILSISAVLGLFYPVKFMDIQFTALLQRCIVDFSVIAISLLSGIFVLTLLFGRFYCSILCPFGILQEFFSFLREKKKNQYQGNFGFKYLISGLTFGVLIGGSALFIRYLDPYTIFGSAFGLSLFGIIATILVLILVFFKNRFFCTNICPVGAILGLISKLSLNKIYVDKNLCVSCGTCAGSCPSGCIDHNKKFINNEMCVKCLKCLNICENKAIKFGVQPIKFSPKRRDFLWGIVALGLLGVGYSVGMNLVKNTAKKIKDIILPAGAENPNRMVNNCLNCNLCVQNCPNKILVKADDNFPVVHIDYKKGKNYCEYNCNKCNEVCLSGAIKKLSLEQKQKIKIATAEVTDSCVGCGKCSSVCPSGAIIWEQGKKAVIDGLKCIGCGKCSASCPTEAINIFAINEQSVI